MIKTKNISGFRKKLFVLRMELAIVFHFLPEVFSGRLSIKEFKMFLKRLLIFLSRIRHNKFVKIGRFTRLGLYIPGFPSRAFFTACRKFMVFNEKLPCTTVLISVTSACRFNCEHCYQKKDLGKDADINVLTESVKYLQDSGVAFCNIEGGEPFLVYDRLKKVCEAIDARSEIWINSTGDNMSLERLKELKERGLTAVMFSMHSPNPDDVNKFMKSDKAWEAMAKGVDMCHEADIPVAFNMCLKKECFYNGVFDRLMEKAKEFGASVIQLIKPKPAGGWMDADVDDFSGEDISKVKGIVNKYNNDPEYQDYPSVSAQIIEEDREVFGCTAGGTDRFYINAKGDVQPCEFLNISFGSIKDADFKEIYKRMRKCFEIPGECWLCEKYSKQISEIFHKNNLDALPLNEELSRKIYQTWDRGVPTNLYTQLR